MGLLAHRSFYPWGLPVGPNRRVAWGSSLPGDLCPSASPWPSLLPTCQKHTIPS